MASKYTLTRKDKATVRTDSESAKFRLLADGYRLRKNRQADKPDDDKPDDDKPATK